ncbi:transmembrane protein 165-like [Cimex lectularius]|uniref:GDT1 family protein n=1 Tax=Cimex lectularius TaxID=79782 RepID=A0A8I6RS07_CIMLE|nr:transmembrane protein 165-like [Cimex lectularius]
MSLNGGHVFLLLCTFVGSLAEKEPFDDEGRKAEAVTTLVSVLVEDVKKPEDSLGFVHGFLASFSVIIVSEIGDKTFFIAAIMAMKHSRMTVFIGAMSALALMTVLSVVFGWAVTIIPKSYTYYISTALFTFCGLKMLYEGYKMSPNEGQEEFDEVQSDLRKREEDFEKEALVGDIESGARGQKNVFLLVSKIVIQAFTLTFLAEWGDRSQFATILLAAREDVCGVTLGGIIGHSICTCLAVIGGRFVAQRISVRSVTMIGGVVFLIFAFSAFFIDTN